MFRAIAHRTTAPSSTSTPASTSEPTAVPTAHPTPARARALGARRAGVALLATLAIGGTADVAVTTATAAPAAAATTTAARTATTSSSTPTYTVRTAAARRRRHRRIVSNRIIRFARSQVGNRYTWDGSNPRTGFDCSGYTMWVYRHADVARLPHKAEWQRHVRHMHRITRRQARPGDLIFYRHGNGPAYHVAIYAGRGWQYSATDPQEGVVHQRIYSRSIEFRTDWH